MFKASTGFGNQPQSGPVPGSPTRGVQQCPIREQTGAAR